MSRGLGAMQRLILDHLEAAKKAHAKGELDYYGAAFSETGCRIHFGDAPVVAADGRYLELPPGVYDLRAVSAFVAEKTGRTRRGRPWYGPGYHIDSSFQASFSRAVRGLLRRGDLVAVRANELRHGLLVAVGSTESPRFVISRRPVEPVGSSRRGDRPPAAPKWLL